MSREIKFRIWDKKHQRWFHGGTDQKSIDLKTDSINLFGEVIVFGEILHDQHEDNVWKDDPDIKSSLDVMEWLEVCQYTGLKDKNGKEIYEGDRIVIENWDTVYTVEYGRGVFIGRYGDEPGDNVCLFHYWLKDGRLNCKVIGTIHENSELLGGEV